MRKLHNLLFAFLLCAPVGAQLSGAYTIDPNGSGARNFKKLNDATVALVEGLRDFFGERRGAMLTATLVLMNQSEQASKKKIKEVLDRLTNTNSPSIWRRLWGWIPGTTPAPNC